MATVAQDATRDRHEKRRTSCTENRDRHTDPDGRRATTITVLYSKPARTYACECCIRRLRPTVRIQFGVRIGRMFAVFGRSRGLHHSSEQP